MIHLKAGTTVEAHPNGTVRVRQMDGTEILHGSDTPEAKQFRACFGLPAEIEPELEKESVRAFRVVDIDRERGVVTLSSE